MRCRASRAARLALALLALLAATGCVRRAGRNSDCRWPGEVPVHAATPWHLSADAEFAEDLAIRYADVHYGLHSPNWTTHEAYQVALTGCGQALFTDVAKQHGVTTAQVAASLGRNRSSLDLAEMLSFAVMYGLLTFAIVRALFRRYRPDENGWTGSIVMAVFLSLVLALGAAMMGEQWCGLIENARIGNGHMSYRMERLLWAHHRPEEFAAAFLLFWLVAAAVARRERSSASMG